MEELPEKEGFDINRSPLKEAYLMLGASTPLELSNLYAEADQKLMPDVWDYNNPDQVVNKIKNILEPVDERLLTEDERGWRREILWFWYHHAISCATSRYKDREAAQRYAQKALDYQPENHPNMITRLFYFLANDKLEEAEKWAEGIDDVDEKDTAADMLKWYKEGKFFK